MGCWNETCGLSNLPICNGDEVVMFVLVKKQNFGRQYYFNDDAIPFILPIEGKYNDYGSIEEVNASDITLNVLENAKVFIKTNDSYTQFYFDLEGFLEQLERGTLYIKYGDEYHQLSQIMYHKDLYYTLVNNMKNRIPYSQDKIFFSLQKEELSKKLEDNIQRKEMFKGLGSSDEEIFEILSSSPIYGQYSLGYKMTNAYEKIITNSNKDLFLEELTTAIMFFNVLSFMRKSFYGQSGLGSQSIEMYLHKKMAEWIIYFYDKKKEEYIEYLEEDEKKDTELIESIFWF